MGHGTRLPPTSPPTQQTTHMGTQLFAESIHPTHYAARQRQAWNCLSTLVLQVRMRFDIETADYLHLMKPEASFPPYHFSMLADAAKYEVGIT